MRKLSQKKTQRGGKQLSRNLKKLRGQAGLTQTQLAYKAGISISSISRWETKSPTRVTKRNLQKLADALEVTIKDLYTKDDSFKEEPIFNKLKKLRRQAGLTQQQLADKANITASYITYLERNPLAYPKQEIMHEIAQALGTTATKLWDISKADNLLSTEEQMLFRAYKNFHKDNRLKLLEKMRKFEEEDERIADHNAKPQTSD